MEEIKKPEEILPAQSREIVESYKLAFGRNAYGLYAQRAKLVLIEAMQDQIQGLSFRNGGCVKYNTTVQEDLFGERTIEVDLRSICPEGMKDFSIVREQLSQMRTLGFEYENEHEWVGVNFFSRVEAKKGSWTATFHTTKDIWEVFMDFSKGYRRLELDTAMQFKSVYALRFYEKVVGQSQPIEYTIDELRAMFQLQKKYKKNDDFVTRVVQAAKDELDKVSPWSFTYQTNYKSVGRGRPSLFSVTIYPERILRNENEDALRRQISPSGYLSKDSLELLKNKFDFKTKEIQHNGKLFEYAEDALDLPSFLRQIAPRALRAKTPKGYVINSIKKELQKKAHIVVESRRNSK